MKPIIGGIQQVGIGIPNCYEAWDWYRQAFRIDVPIFDEKATAELMLPYTGGKPRERHAVLAMSMQGGGGIEIWQYTQRSPQAPSQQIHIGDLGIFGLKVKSKNVASSKKHFDKNSLPIVDGIRKAPDGKDRCFTIDPYGNYIEIVASDQWYLTQSASTGGVYGCIIGVSDMAESLDFYEKILGYDKVLYDEVGVFEDYKALPGGQEKMRRCLLTHTEERRGPFSQWIGPSELELVQKIDSPATKIFEDRLWGDLGFIHLCFDIQGMDEMRTLCESHGHAFTVDSGKHFDMGEAAGHFSYIEDPDGTLIEFVEAHRIPILKSMNWYLDLKKRSPEKPLPKWMLRCLGFNRNKD